MEKNLEISNQDRLTTISYDPVLVGNISQISKSLFSRRLFLIAQTIWKFARFNSQPSNTQTGNHPLSQRKAKASQLRDAFTRLGVTFIKLGQFLSMRPDILPVELTDELSLLQDQVPAFPFEQVKEIVEKELGAKLDQLFQSFDLEPMASASIGQVHRAFLNDGKLVAVKVQRRTLPA